MTFIHLDFEANQNNAGVYGAVARIGQLAVQTILLRAATEKIERGR